MAGITRNSSQSSRQSNLASLIDLENGRVVPSVLRSDSSDQSMGVDRGLAATVNAKYFHTALRPQWERLINILSITCKVASWVGGRPAWN